MLILQDSSFHNQVIYLINETASPQTPANSISIQQWITLVSLTVVVLGWFVNAWINRKHDISKTRLQFRMKTLEMCLDFIFFVENTADPLGASDYGNRVEEVKKQLEFYGALTEQKYFHQLIDALEKNMPTAEVLSVFREKVKSNTRELLKI